MVSRDLGRATEFAKAHGAAQALDSYPAMLADPAVQAVYIATPNALHAGQLIAAAQAGKHMLRPRPDRRGRPGLGTSRDRGPRPAHLPGHQLRPAGVSLTIRDGACTVLLGRNGMGKITLVHSIMA